MMMVQMSLLSENSADSTSIQEKTSLFTNNKVFFYRQEITGDNTRLVLF